MLRILRLTNVKCAALVEDLKRYDFSSGGQLVAGTVNEKSADNSSPLAAMLDLCMEEMFMTYLDAGRYLELETRWLTGNYKDMLSAFERYHVSPVAIRKYGYFWGLTSIVLQLNIIKSKPHSLLDRVVNQLSSSSTIPSTQGNAPGGTGAASTAAAWLHKYGGVANSFGNTASGNASHAVSGRASPAPSGPPTPRLEDQSQADNAARLKGNEADAALETSLAERMLKLHAEAVGRVVELSLPGDM